MTSTESKYPRFVILIFMLLGTGFIAAQQYANGWINHSLRYHKFPVYREGIYRIDSATLSKYYDLGQTDPRQFRLFLKGKEQRLHVQGESDGKVNTGDYLEFYASNFTGDVDSLIYSGIAYVPNPWSPLFNDTIYAFLTLDPGGPHQRYTLETDTSGSLYPAEAYFYSEKKRVFRDAYNDVVAYEDLSDPRYTQAEGWGTQKGKGGYEYAAFPPLYSYQNPLLNAYFTVGYSGKSKSKVLAFDHEARITFSDANNNTQVLSDTVYSGFAPIRQTFTINAQDIGNGSEFFFFSVASPSFSAISNITVLHYFYLFYPRSLNLGGSAAHKLVTDNDPNAPKGFYKFSGLNLNGSTEALLYDIDNGRKISTVIDGPFVRAVIPNGSGSRNTLFIAASGAVDSVKKLSPVNTGGTFRDFLSGDPAGPYVIIHHKNLQSAAAAYKAYRESPQGGSHKVVMADIDELYEQFGYGINKHPLAIRNFLRLLKDSLSAGPNYVLLIGASAKAEAYNPSHPLNYVPTMGRPCSDNLLTTGLSQNNFDFYPEIPVGRISAVNHQEVNAYLDKVKEHEASGEADWKKKVLHFIGGSNDNELKQFSAYMNAYKDLIEDTLFGASVYTFKKTSSAPVQVILSDSIKQMVSNGASLLTFFGHGSQQGFDQAIDEPELYNNTGRYPFVLANSCYSGEIHDPVQTSVSKRFVFAKSKGSIGFLASTSLGYTHSLDHYSGKFYRALGGSHYHKGIGDIVKQAAADNATSGEFITKLASLDMTLHGDPALKIGNGLLPDYQIRNSDVSFNLQSNQDSIALLIKLRNNGRAVNDSFQVLVERFFPNGDSTGLLRTVPAPYHLDSLRLVIPVDQQKGIGLNQFRVRLDYVFRIAESNETNNSTSGLIDLFIPGSDVVPVYPYKFAIVPVAPSLTLKACTSDPFAPPATYIFQLDTNDRFNNPIQSATITSRGGVLEWQVNTSLKDSSVYFWRVSRDSVSPAQPYAWRESSFQTITGQRGWAQAHFDQFKNNSYQLVTHKKDLRQFVFENRLNTVDCRTGYYPYLPESQNTYFFNNNQMDSWSCSFNGWNFAVFDSITGLPKGELNPGWPNNSGIGPYNNCMCNRANQYHYVYYFGHWSECGSDTASFKANMENFLNAIPQNNYVLAYTTGNRAERRYSNVSTFSNALYTAFESIGAKDIRTLEDTIPYILFGRKGMSAGQGHVLKGSSKRSILFLQDSIRTRWNNGYVATEPIGPSMKWKSLHWRVKSLDNVAGDSTLLKLVGIRNNGVTDTLATYSQSNSDVYNLEQVADATVYPYLKLVAYMKDDANRTSPQLDRWQVLFDEAPECAINPLKGFVSINDSLQEGDQVIFRVPVENIGERNFEDSLVITYWIEDKARNKNDLPPTLKSRPFVPGQVLSDTIKINSYQLAGDNAVWMTVNPPKHSRYQPEQYHFNNVARLPFVVKADVTNPLLDVTFDGRRILNGDLVSARPHIHISVKDENKFLALNDTSAFTVLLQAPGQSQPQRIYFAQALEFSPASLPKNSAGILYRPNLVTDGKYLLTVQAHDRSNNFSARQDYRIQFEVNNHPSITNVINYPNPFTTSTRFVFTLTGSEIPEVFTIQIMTITGKLVREITRDELGPLRIGRNITDYAWDGKDEFGDRLANGVYLYRIRTKLNGENIEKSASGADQFITKEFGKMVLMR